MIIAVMAAAVVLFMLGSRVRRVSYAWLAPVVLVWLVSLALVSAARSDELYTGEVGIWKTRHGVYTNMPYRYEKASPRRWYPSRDRLTTVVSKTKPHQWAAVASVRLAPRARLPFCTGVYLGNSAISGGVTLCRGEVASVHQERVRRRGRIMTTTDTVLRVGKREVMRIHGGVYPRRR